jgi:hypothetical protein
MLVRGAAHVHSTFSFDGKLTHRQLRELFLSRGFQFALMSEHIEYQTPDTLRSAIDACARESTQDFLFVPGIEIDDLHILMYGVPSVPDGIDCIDLFRHARAAGSLIALSHPIKIRGQLNPEVVDALRAVEIWNGRYDGKLFPRWANLRYLAIGNLPVPIIGHDLHSAADISKLAIELEVPSLEAGAIIAGRTADPVRSLDLVQESHLHIHCCSGYELSHEPVPTPSEVTHSADGAASAQEDFMTRPLCAPLFTKVFNG